MPGGKYIRARKSFGAGPECGFSAEFWFKGTIDSGDKKKYIFRFTDDSGKNKFWEIWRDGNNIKVKPKGGSDLVYTNML